MPINSKKIWRKLGSNRVLSTSTKLFVKMLSVRQTVACNHTQLVVSLEKKLRLC